MGSLPRTQLTTTPATVHRTRGRATAGAGQPSRFFPVRAPTNARAIRSPCEDTLSAPRQQGEREPSAPPAPARGSMRGTKR